MLATVGALLQHGLANRVPTAVVASVAAAVLLLLLGWCRPGQATGPYVSFLLLLLLLQPGWCRARGPYVPLLLLLLYCDILLDKWVDQDTLFVPPLFFS